MIDPHDHHITQWAARRGSPWYYTQERGLPSPCLKVQCGYVTAYFHQGRLVRLWAQADSAGLNELFMELTQIFRLKTGPDPLALRMSG